MAPLYDATQVEEVSNDSKDGGRVFRISLDGEWVIGSVPHGGYMLAVLLDACVKAQATTAQKDPIHLTSHFLRANTVGPCEIRVKTIKTGKGYTNLEADVTQRGQTTLSARLIFGSLAPWPPSPASIQTQMTLVPPSPFFPPHPLHTLPSASVHQHSRYHWGFNAHVRSADDPAVAFEDAARGGMETGMWLELKDARDSFASPAALAFAADAYLATPFLLPHSPRHSWYPTLTLSMEFKFALPPGAAARTVGLHARSRFMIDGRHDTYCEIWSAPANISDGEDTKPGEDWRARQVCLATAHQMALIIPATVNKRLGGPGVKGTKL